MLKRWCVPSGAAGIQVATEYEKRSGSKYGGIYKTNYRFGLDPVTGYLGMRVHLYFRDGTHYSVNGDGSHPHRGKTRMRYRRRFV